MKIAKDGTRAVGIISGICLLFKERTPERGLVDVNVIREMIVLLRSESTR
jgi:hypothetical protein